MSEKKEYNGYQVGMFLSSIPMEGKENLLISLLRGIDRFEEGLIHLLEGNDMDSLADLEFAGGNFTLHSGGDLINPLDVEVLRIENNLFFRCPDRRTIEDGILKMIEVLAEAEHHPLMQIGLMDMDQLRASFTDPPEQNENLN